MAVLIVGASGGLGSAVREHLAAADVEVIAVGRNGPVTGDVRRPGLGLGWRPPWAERVTSVVSCFGSVDLAGPPADVLAVHQQGTRNLLDLARRLPHLTRFVHVSSLAVLGDHGKRRIAGPQLHVGQRFRSWYEYAKHRAEADVRDSDLPWRVVRFGPLLPPRPRLDDPLALATTVAVRGLPVPLAERGRFPSFTSSTRAAAEVVVQALNSDGAGDVWSWVDPAGPSMSGLLAALCRPWRVAPRLVALPRWTGMSRVAARRTGLPPAIVAYATPLLNVEPADLTGPPASVPVDPGDIAAAADGLFDRLTGAALTPGAR